jgi:hypothetical protein
MGPFFDRDGQHWNINRRSRDGHRRPAAASACRRYPIPTPSGTAALCSVTVTVPACEVTNNRDADPVVPRCVVQLTVVGEDTDVGAVVSDSSPQATVQQLASSTQTVTHRAVVVTSERTERKTPPPLAAHRCR